MMITSLPVLSVYLENAVCCVQLLMELQKVAFKADDSDGPILQSLSSFVDELHTIVDKQLKVFLCVYT